MDKSTVTTYTFTRCCINIYPDGNMSFQDYTTADTIELDGMDTEEVQRAIKYYVARIGSNSKSKEWLKDMHTEISSSLAMLEGATND